jgi:hypothetical protein
MPVPGTVPSIGVVPVTPALLMLVIAVVGVFLTMGIANIVVWVWPPIDSYLVASGKVPFSRHHFSRILALLDPPTSANRREIKKGTIFEPNLL